jgi:hypothetical protein
MSAVFPRFSMESRETSVFSYDCRMLECHPALGRGLVAVMEKVQHELETQSDARPTATRREYHSQDIVGVNVITSSSTPSSIVTPFFYYIVLTVTHTHTRQFYSRFP